MVSEKMNVFVKNRVLRLSVSKVNPKTLDKFDVKIVAKHQKQVAQFIKLLLKVAVELDNKDKNSMFNNKKATVELGDRPLSEQKLSSKK